MTAVERDAARWRISQVVYRRLMDRPHGYFVIRPRLSDEPVLVGIQPHPVTKLTAVNDCVLGSGPSVGEAIDAMFLALDALVEAGHCLSDELDGPRLLAANSRDITSDEVQS